MSTSRPAVADPRTLLPPVHRVFRVQLESVAGRVGLATIAVTLMVAVGITINVLTREITDQQGAFGWGMLPYFGMAQSIGMAVALLFPAAVWDGLPPHRRTALHALPVDRKKHELLRVAAGGTIVLLAVGIIYLMAVAMHARLATPGRPTPSGIAYLLGAGSLAIGYLLASVAGLVTRSTLGTILRFLVWGFLGGLLLNVLGSRYALATRLADGLIGTLVGGDWGIGTAWLAGLQAMRGIPGAADRAPAVAAWVVAGLVAVWLAAGRLPRSGRG